MCKLTNAFLTFSSGKFEVEVILSKYWKSFSRMTFGKNSAARHLVDKCSCFCFQFFVNNSRNSSNNNNNSRNSNSNNNNSSNNVSIINNNSRFSSNNNSIIKTAAAATTTTVVTAATTTAQQQQQQLQSLFSSWIPWDVSNLSLIDFLIVMIIRINDLDWLKTN